MNFTREPIIETIVSPKEGCKLLVRSSKSGANAEEYYVDAVEVVSFGQAFFFRSLERPKAFLVPVSDYEVLEVKETRVALKNVSHERNIKIGGGRDAPMRHREPAQERDNEPAVAEEEEERAPNEQLAQEAPNGGRLDKRRDRRRRRHRRSSDESQEWNERRVHDRGEREPTEQESKGGGAEEEVKTQPQSFPALIPPPTTLISETISRYKEVIEGNAQAKEAEEKQKKEKPPVDEDSSGADSAPLHRTSISASESQELPSLTSTNFSPLQGGRDSFFF